MLPVVKESTALKINLEILKRFLIFSVLHQTIIDIVISRPQEEIKVMKIQRHEKYSIHQFIHGPLTTILN